MEGRKFGDGGSCKRLCIEVAEVQGLQANYDRYMTLPLKARQRDRCSPLFMFAASDGYLDFPWDFGRCFDRVYLFLYQVIVTFSVPWHPWIAWIRWIPCIPRDPWISMESIESMDIHGIHGHPWISMESMESMDSMDMEPCIS